PAGNERPRLPPARHGSRPARTDSRNLGSGDRKPGSRVSAGRRLRFHRKAGRPPASPGGAGVFRAEARRSGPQGRGPERASAGVARAGGGRRVRVGEKRGGGGHSTTPPPAAGGSRGQAKAPRHSGGATTLSIVLPDSDTRLDVPSVLVRADADGYAFNFEDRD